MCSFFPLENLAANLMKDNLWKKINFANRNNNKPYKCFGVQHFILFSRRCVCARINLYPSLSLAVCVYLWKREQMVFGKRVNMNICANCCDEKCKIEFISRLVTCIFTDAARDTKNTNNLVEFRWLHWWSTDECASKRKIECVCKL